MFVADRDIAAGPAIGSGGISLSRCWADSANARRALAEGRHETYAAPACMAEADPAGIGLCADCRREIVG